MTTLAHILIFIWYIKSRRMAYYNTISCDSQAGITGASVGEKLHNTIGKDLKPLRFGVGFFFSFLPFKNASAAETEENLREGIRSVFCNKFT